LAELYCDINILTTACFSLLCLYCILLHFHKYLVY